MYYGSGRPRLRQMVQKRPNRGTGRVGLLESNVQGALITNIADDERQRRLDTSNRDGTARARR